MSRKKKSVRSAGGRNASGARSERRGKAAGPVAPRVRRRSASPDRRVVVALLLILVAGLALRGAYLKELSATPDFRFPLVDADYHDYWARGIASGNWSPPQFEPDPQIQQRPYFRPPGYPFVLGAVYTVMGRGYVAPRVVQMLAGLVSALLLFFIARRLFGDLAALIAAALMSVYWVFVYFEGEFLEPSFVVPLSLAIVLLLLKWLDKRRTTLLWGVGALLGFLSLMRPNALLWLPTVAVWVYLALRARREMPKLVPGLAALAIGAAVLILPVTARNYSVARDLVPISTNGGINLYIGNNDNADGLVRGTMPGIGTLDTSFDWPQVASNVSRIVGRPLKDSEVSDYLAGRAWQWIRAHPARAAGLVVKKTALFWGPTEPADNKVVAGDRAASRALRAVPLTFAIVLALALAGVVLYFARRRSDSETAKGKPDARREAVTLMLSLALVWYASHLPFAITARYRVPVIPFLIVFGAYFVERVFRLAARRDYRRAGVWLGVLAATLVITHIDLVPNDRPSMARWHYQRGIAYTHAAYKDPRHPDNVKLSEAVDEYRAALDLNPDYAAVYNDLATALANQGRVAESVPYFLKALEGRPDDPTMQLNAALALELTGDLERSHAHYAEALRLRPGDPDARAGLERTGREPAAEAAE